MTYSATPAPIRIGQIVPSSLELEPVAPNCGALLASAEGRTSPLKAG